LDRRRFLERCGLGAWIVTGLGVARALMAYMRPHSLLEPPTRVVVARRDRITDGTVIFDRDQKVVVVGTPGGVYAMSAVCPHLGCMTRFKAESGLIDCACHGSAFTLKGEPLYGPSGPLRWLEVTVNERNEVVVDTNSEIPAGKVFNG
jgi:Rieske Fe-S protein